MIDVDTLVHARWVIPVAPRATVLERHAVAITNGRIVGVAPSAEAGQLYRATDVQTLDDHALTPGLVNCHTHAAMALLRGIGDDLPLMRWLKDRIWPLEAALISADFVHDGGQLAALEMLRSGTTTCSDMYFYPDASLRALRSLGMRAVAGIVAIEFPTAYAADAEDYLRKGLATRDLWRGDPLVSFTLAPHAPYTVADQTLKRIAVLAEELDLPIHTHVHETEDEISESIAKYGCRPLERLDRLGIVSERLIAVHAVHLNPHEVQLMAQRGASVAHCPASNLKLGSGLAPVAKLLAAGVNVAIGTDGAASNNRIDMMAEVRLAALLAKGVAHDASAFSAPEALESATLGGARALGLDRRIGSIEIGKEADLVAFDLSSVETQPLYDVVSQIVYAAGREHVSNVWIAGKPVVRKRHVVADSDGSLEKTLLASVSAWQNRCRQVLLTSGAV
ncbi:MAG: TRZ/ATZ family hydrolase [Pseudomonadota bacterium]|nr:TRZ/ATZ family hydrolase [Pseudomonadota bacterium]